MEKLLKEIENNLATLRCRLEEQGVRVQDIQVDSWTTGLGFKIGVWNGDIWLRQDHSFDYQYSIAEFCALMKRKKILFRKFNGGVKWRL